jgi:hypothetical protein
MSRRRGARRSQSQVPQSRGAHAPGVVQAAADKSRTAELLTAPAARLDDGAAISELAPKTPVRQLLMEVSTREYFEKRRNGLYLERSTWMQHWREIAEYFAPRRQRIWPFDRNKGTKKHEKVINCTGPIALRTLGNGMHSGLTSPARPWFKLGTPVPELAEIPSVAFWLMLVQRILEQIFTRSNIYSQFPQAYQDQAAFGSTVLWLDEHPRKVITTKLFPVGSYMLGSGADGEVDTVYRDVSMTVANAVDAFGLKACSPGTQEKYKRGQLDEWLLLSQCCEPNRTHDPENPFSKRWVSAWFEREAGPKGQLLRQSGYNSRPFAAPRWNVCGEDIYGYSAAMEALGDQRALQQLERRKLRAADKVVEPPMVAPASLKFQRVSMLPGDVSYLDDATPSDAKFGPVMTVPPEAIVVDEKSIAEHATRIKEVFMTDLWLAIMQDQRATPATAEEVRAKADERMLQIGPTIERQEEEMLDVVIDRTFEVALDRGFIPPPPPELQEAAAGGDDELRVEYISILAQAQRMVGTAADDRLIAVAGNLAKLGRADALDLLNVDRIVRDYAAKLGCSPKALMPQQLVEQLRGRRVQQQQAEAQSQQQLAQAQALAHAGRGAQSLAAAPIDDSQGETALTGLLSKMGPMASASASGAPMGS